MKKLNLTMNSIDFALWGIMFAINWKVFFGFFFLAQIIMSHNAKKK